MKPTKRDDPPAQRWGDHGGRGCHPADPKGEIFGKGHWPMALPHEKLDWTGKTVGHLKTERHETPGMRVQQAVADAVKKEVKTTTTGLITQKDFIKEAEKVGVLDDTIATKITKWFARDDVGEGMKRMQCNQLIRNAIKRKEAK